MIEERRPALEYDWRTRFHLPLTVVGKSMPWGEAVRMVRILRADPSSMLAASIEGWAHPVSRADMIAMDGYDLARQAAGDKKWKGYPRPWDALPQSIRRGNAAGRTPDEVKAILATQFGQSASA